MKIITISRVKFVAPETVYPKAAQCKIIRKGEKKDKFITLLPQSVSVKGTIRHDQKYNTQLSTTFLTKEKI